MKKFAIVVFLFCFPNLLPAKTLVFIHGYMEEGMSWRNSHVVTPLLQQGWLDGGTLTTDQQGIIHKYPATRVPLQNDVFYSVELPWTRPIAEQSQVLARYTGLIYVARQQAITLVGHSIGGIVSRHYLVSQSPTPVNALITIATPHLGTPLAKLGYLVSKVPLNPLAGIDKVESLKRSQQLLHELSPEKPNTYLYWLNHQAHPTIAYLSIIRKNDTLKFQKFDYAVPTYSQDMNKVFALRDRAMKYLTNGGHSLGQVDGWIITEFMQSLP